MLLLEPPSCMDLSFYIFFLEVWICLFFSLHSPHPLVFCWIIAGTALEVSLAAWKKQEQRKKLRKGFMVSMIDTCSQIYGADGRLPTADTLGANRINLFFLEKIKLRGWGIHTTRSFHVASSWKLEHRLYKYNKELFVWSSVRHLIIVTL